MSSCDVIVLGAGAAGLMAGIEAARRGRRVVVVDHAAKPGEKIRISGGGRCNFTNLATAPDRFLSANPRFAISALSRFTPRDFLKRIEGAGIAWTEKAAGQLFCQGSATQVVTLLTDDLARAGGELWLGCALGAVRREVRGFAVETARGVVRAEAVVVATGGKSIPKMGATGFGYRIAEDFGLPVTETRPGLVPMTLAEQELAVLSPLAGIAVTGTATTGRRRFAEAILFTHRGLSGPAILQLSSYWREGQPVELDLCPGLSLPDLVAAGRVEGGRMVPRTLLSRILPERLARLIETDLGLDKPVATLSKADIARLEDRLHRWTIRPVGTEGYRTAEVTVGGVDTTALDGRTLQAKGVPGLYFVGEVVDVTGWLGGYNFQWAWSSGWAAGQVA